MGVPNEADFACYAAAVCRPRRWVRRFDVVRELGPQNDEIAASLPDSFTYIASNLENVSDKVSLPSGPTAQQRVEILHQSFLPHGYGLLIIKDAVGTVVDSTLLEYQLETLSLPGVPGEWTITLIYTSALGRAQFVLLPVPANFTLPTARGASRAFAAADHRRPASGPDALLQWAKEADNKRRR